MDSIPGICSVAEDLGILWRRPRCSACLFLIPSYGHLLAWCLSFGYQIFACDFGHTKKPQTAKQSSIAWWIESRGSATGGTGQKIFKWLAT